jgi:hypothetical protein
MHMQELDEDWQTFNKINSSQDMDLLGIEGCFTSVLFSVTPAEQQQLQEDYKRSLEAMDKVIIFEELHKVFIAYIGSPKLSLDYQYGLKHLSFGSSQPSLSVHWKNNDGSALMLYNLKSLSCIIGSQSNNKDWSMVKLPIACNYVQYVKLNQHINGISDMLHDWRDSFEHAWSCVHLDIRKSSFTKQFDNNALFLD